MKLLTQKLTIALAILLVLPGCEDPKETYKEFIKKETIYISKPKVSAVPSAINKAKFFVKVSPDPKLDSIKILDVADKLVYGAKVDQTALKDDMIDFHFEISFDAEQEGNQTLWAILQDKDNNKSLSQEISVRILGKRYESRLLRRRAKVAVGGKGLIFEWSDVPTNSYESTIAYTNAAGKAMTKAVPHVDGEGNETKKTILSDVKPGSTLKVYTSYKPSSDEGVGVFQSKGQEYKMEMPVIESISPEKGLAGAEITLTGKNFHPTAKENKVLFGTVKATVSKASATSLTVKAPKMNPGDHAVTIKVGAVTVPGKTFKVEMPEITAISPVEGREGEEVTLTGKNFHATAKENKVFFGTVEATVSKADATSLTVKVPKVALGAHAVTIKVETTTVPGKTFTVLRGKTINIALSHKDDDVEESINNSISPEHQKDYTAGKMHLESEALEFGKFDNDKGIGEQLVGVRFRGVKIPKGATIHKASIVFMADATGYGACKIQIHGEAAANAAEYKDESKNLSKRKKTTANAEWDIKPWLKAGDKGKAQTTADLKAIVQEIIAQTGWASDNAMNFIFTPEASGVTDGRKAETFDGKDSDKAQAPVLTIVYEE